MEQLDNVVTDGNNFAIVDKTAKIKSGDTAYSVDMGFYKVGKEDVSHANENHWKVTHELIKKKI